MNIEAIIFDFIGVIQPDPLRFAYEKCGGDFDRDEAFVRDAIIAEQRGWNSSAQQDIADRLKVSVEEWIHMLGTARYDERLLESIGELKQRYRIGLLSNMGRGGLDDFMNHQDSGRYFDAVQTSGESGVAKPDAEAFQRIADRLGTLVEACIMVDDQREYCDAAKALGMHTHVYTSYKRFRGYLKDTSLL